MSNGYESEAGRVLSQTSDGGSLPFTGEDLLILVVLGVTFLLVGLYIKSLARPPRP